MNTYTFKKAFSQGWVKIAIEASSYKEALAGLIFQIGSEVDAAKYTFVEVKSMTDLYDLLDAENDATKTEFAQ